MYIYKYFYLSISLELPKHKIPWIPTSKGATNNHHRPKEEAIESGEERTYSNDDDTKLLLLESLQHLDKKSRHSSGTHWHSSTEWMTSSAKSTPESHISEQMQNKSWMFAKNSGETKPKTRGRCENGGRWTEGGAHAAQGRSNVNNHGKRKMRSILESCGTMKK